MKPYYLLPILTAILLTACGGGIERVDPTPTPTPKPDPSATPAYSSPLGAAGTPNPAANSGDWMWTKKTPLDEPASSSGKGGGKKDK